MHPKMLKLKRCGYARYLFKCVLFSLIITPLAFAQQKESPLEALVRELEPKATEAEPPLDTFDRLNLEFDKFEEESRSLKQKRAEEEKAAKEMKESSTPTPDPKIVRFHEEAGAFLEVQKESKVLLKNLTMLKKETQIKYKKFKDSMQKLLREKATKDIFSNSDLRWFKELEMSLDAQQLRYEKDLTAASKVLDLIIKDRSSCSIAANRGQREKQSTSPSKEALSTCSERLKKATNELSTVKSQIDIKHAKMIRTYDTSSKNVEVLKQKRLIEDKRRTGKIGVR